MTFRPTRQLLPKPTRQDFSAQPPSDPLKKRKRQTVLVACERCRKRKCKCDGERPSCHVCRHAMVDCEYPSSTSIGKGKDDQHLRDIVDALLEIAAPGPMELLNSIQLAPTLEEAVAMVRTLGVGQHAFISRPYVDSSSLNGVFPNPPRRLYANIATSERSSDEPTLVKLPISLWTSISSDEDTLTHLYTLFWTWDSMLTRVIHRTMLTEDLCARRDAMTSIQDGSRVQFCSEFLINSILTVSTIYSLKSDNPNAPVVHGRPFADEAIRLLESEEMNPSLPLLQGIAALALYEHGAGDLATAASLFDKLFRLHSTLEWPATWIPSGSIDDDARAKRTLPALSFIAWGFYCLDAKLSLVLDRCMSINKPQSLATDYRHDEPLDQGADPQHELWFPYPISSQLCPSYFKEGFIAECILAELTEKALIQIEIDQTSPVPDYESAKKLSDRMFDSKHSMGSKVKGDRSQLPTRVYLLYVYHGSAISRLPLRTRGSVLTAFLDGNKKCYNDAFDSLSYYVLMIKLLKPFVRLSFLEFNGGQTASALTLLYSDTIISALWNYSTAFSMRHDYWMLEACQVAAVAMVVHPQPMSAQRETFVRACQLLYDMGERLPYANNILSGLRKLLADKDISVPDDARRFLAAGKVREGYMSLEDTSIVRD